MDRKIKTISDLVGDLLVKQIAHELFNHNLYRTFANFFALEGIVSLEKYYIARAEEELVHHRWIVDRLNEADYDFMYPAVEAVTEKFEDIVDPFKLTVLKEIETTELIDKIADAAFKESDWQTLTWLQLKLIPEQHEEETTSRTALDIIAKKDDCSIYEKAEEVYKLLNH